MSHLRAQVRQLPRAQRAHARILFLCAFYVFCVSIMEMREWCVVASARQLPTLMVACSRSNAATLMGAIILPYHVLWACQHATIGLRASRGQTAAIRMTQIAGITLTVRRFGFFGGWGMCVAFTDVHFRIEMVVLPYTYTFPLHQIEVWHGADLSLSGPTNLMWFHLSYSVFPYNVLLPQS